MNESAVRRLVTYSPPFEVSGRHLVANIFPIYIPDSAPDASFGSLPIFPLCDPAVTPNPPSYCYLPATKERLWGW